MAITRALATLPTFRSQTAPSPDWRCAWRLWCLLLVAYLLTMPGRLGSGDGETMYLTTRALLTQGHLGIVSRPEASEGRHGRFYSKYGLAESAAQAPLFVVGHFAGKLFGAVDDRVDRFAVSATNSLVGATLGVTFWLVLRALGVRRAPAAAATLVLGFATVIWPYSREDFSEPLQTTTLLLSFYALLRWRRRPALRWPALAGAAAGAAFLTKAAEALLLGPLALYFAIALWQHIRMGSVARGLVPRNTAARERGTSPRATATTANVLDRRRSLSTVSRHVLAAGIPFGACVLFQLALNVYRFGSPTDFGYGAEPATGFTTPALEGIRLLLLSSGKGLFLFCPAVLVGMAMWPALARRHPLETATAVLVFLVDLLYYARWWAWHGDWSWGPRYLVVTIPFLMLGWGLLFERWREAALPLKLTAAALASASLAAAFLGVSIDYHSYYEVIAYQLGRGVDVQEARVVPEFSPLLGHYWLAKASLYDSFFGGKAPAAGGATAAPPKPNPYLRDYPWANSHPELYPSNPEHQVGFGFWFATKEPRLPFIRFWSGIVACWLLCSLVPLSLRLWRAAAVPAEAEPAVSPAAVPQPLSAVPAMAS